MVVYRLFFSFYGWYRFSLVAGTGNTPAGLDPQDLPEGEWVDERPDAHQRARGPERDHFRDPHGYLGCFAASPVGEAMIRHLGAPFAVRCEVETTMP